jgi:hypothetical protein
MQLPLVCVGLLIATPVAADPLIDVRVDSDRDLGDFARLVDRVEQPAGLLAVRAVPTLGLESGDLVVGINGRPTSSFPAEDLRSGRSSIIYLDVRRGTSNVVLRLSVKSSQERIAMSRDELKRQLNLQGRGGFRQLTEKGKPTAVRIDGRWLADGASGATIFMIDGKLIRTVDEAAGALAAAAKDEAAKRIVFELTRLDRRPYWLQIDLAEPKR